MSSPREQPASTRRRASSDYTLPEELFDVLVELKADTSSDDDSDNEQADPSTDEIQREDSFDCPVSLRKDELKIDKHEKTDDDTVRIAIVDYDNTAICTTSHHYLSPALVTILQNGNYQALYGCTHRTFYATAKCIKQYYEAQFESKSKEKRNLTEVDFWDVFTTQIGPNLERVTKIPFIEVSTPEDANAPEREKTPFGSGCRNLLDPYEKILAAKINKAILEQKVRETALEIKIALDILNEEHEKGHEAIALLEKKEVNVQNPVAKFDTKTKNNQLLSILQHAANIKYPGKKLIFDFFDDNDAVLASAKKLQPGDLPPGCTLNIHYHNANTELISHNHGFRSQQRPPVTIRNSHQPIVASSAAGDAGDQKRSIQSSTATLKLAFLKTYNSELLNSEKRNWDKMTRNRKLRLCAPKRIKDSRGILASLDAKILEADAKNIDLAASMTIDSVFEKISKIINRPEKMSLVRHEDVSKFFRLKKDQLALAEADIGKIHSKGLRSSS